MITDSHPKMKERADKLAAAQGVLESAKASGRESLTPEESRRVKGLFAEIDEIDKWAKGADEADQLMARMGGHGSPAEPESKGAAGRWAKSVTDRMRDAAAMGGVKALLTGEIATAPVVQVVDLPSAPTGLLELIPRERLNEATYAYLRQTEAVNNADVVADNATKPTSTYTFEEVEDRARVIAHLSEPFPIRYAADHSSMLQVLRDQMFQGVSNKIEDLVVNGDGTGEEWEGILLTEGTTAVPFTTDRVTTLRKARTALEVKGERVTAVAMNPLDVEVLDLLRENGATGGFLLDGTAYEMIFGRGIKGVASIAIPAGTAIVGDWNQTRLRVREDTNTMAATQAGDLFDKNQMKLRCEGRYGFQILRPQALAVVDLVA